MSVAGPLERRRLATGYAAGNQGFPAWRVSQPVEVSPPESPIPGSRVEIQWVFRALGTVSGYGEAARGWPLRPGSVLGGRQHGASSLSRATCRRRASHRLCTTRLYKWIVAPHSTVRNLASKCRRWSDDLLFKSGSCEDARSAARRQRTKPCCSASKNRNRFRSLAARPAPFT